jgi:hypothetical protein
VTPDIEGALVHELTHSFIAALAGNHLPSWLNEGIAQFEEGKTAWPQSGMLTELQKRDQLIPLAKLSGELASLPEHAAGLAYLQGLSAVEFLTARNGRQALRLILDLLHQKYNLENAWQTATGQSLADFEKAWRASLSTNSR